MCGEGFGIITHNSQYLKKLDVEKDVYYLVLLAFCSLYDTGVSQLRDLDGFQYTTLGYSNGPFGRQDLTHFDTGKF